MLRPLANARRKVEQLATEARSGRCDGNHRRYQVVEFADDPLAPWPECDRGGRCACGAGLRFVKLVMELRPLITGVHAAGRV